MKIICLPLYYAPFLSLFLFMYIGLLQWCHTNSQMIEKLIEIKWYEEEKKHDSSKQSEAKQSNK